jgi:hypothetical protein
LVTSYTEIIPTMKNHEGDRHVLAAAIVGKADVIVTDNLTHFPQSVCRDFDLEVQTADGHVRQAGVRVVPLHPALLMLSSP